MVIAIEQTPAVAHKMSAQEDCFLDIMETLSTSLKHLLLPGSCCNSLGSCHISPSSCGRSLGCGGRVGGSSSGVLGSSGIMVEVGKTQAKASRKGKEKPVEKPVDESETDLEGGSNSDASGEEVA